MKSISLPLFRHQRDADRQNHAAGPVQHLAPVRDSGPHHGGDRENQDDEIVDQYRIHASALTFSSFSICLFVVSIVLISLFVCWRGSLSDVLASTYCCSYRRTRPFSYSAWLPPRRSLQ